MKTAGRFRFLEVGEIDWVAADGDQVRLHLGKAQRRLHRTLTEMRSACWTRPASSASIAPRS